MKNHRHFILHKPVGYLSQFVYNQTKRKNKKLLGDLHDFPEGTMAIGRLDENSEGLLLLTTNGMVSEQLRSKSVEKEYHVELDGEISDEALVLLRKGVEIGIAGTKYLTLPCKVKRLLEIPPYETAHITRERHRPTSWISIIITEGKNRQIRKMTAAVGFPTHRLIRIRIGSVVLGDLPIGETIEVDSFSYPTTG